jgi:hypothetical protein
MLKCPTKSIYFSRFVPTWDLGGGSRRLMQLWELLKTMGSELWTSAGRDRLDAETWQRLEKDAGSMENREYLAWSPQRRPVVFRLREIAKAWSQVAGGFAGTELVFMDDPIYFLPLLEHLELRRIPVVAICHNLETLAASQVQAEAAQGLFLKELDILSRCRLVITISQEETWLLNNLHIPCFYFPYHPQDPVLGRLLAVRQKRLESRGSHSPGVLMLANLKNPQSIQGATHLIVAWRKQLLSRTWGPLLVAGFQSEQAFPADLFDHDVRLLGTLENDRLDELMSQVAACLCYQDNGSGALTRIREMLIAAVPVLANSHAARSYHNMKGVIEFAGLDGLGEALERLNEFTGDIPVPPPPDQAALFAAIKRAGKGAS